MTSDQCGCVKLVVGSWWLSRISSLLSFSLAFVYVPLLVLVLIPVLVFVLVPLLVLLLVSRLLSLNDAVTSTLPRCPRPRPCCRPEVLSQGDAGGQVQSQAVETTSFYSISDPNFSAGLLTSALSSSKTSLPTFPWPGSGLFLRLW